MSASGLRVIKPGTLTLLQDLGRYGYQHLGLSPGGAVDEHAFLWANRLLGNASSAPALEVTLGGLQLEAERRVCLAITGADLQPTLNGRPLQNWSTLSLAPGDQLHFGYPRQGVRAYVAVLGGFQVAASFGAVATVTREGIGGLDGWGAPLAEGDRLPYADAVPVPNRQVPPRYIPDYRQPLTLRLMENENVGWFDDALGGIYRSDFKVSQRSDRMGVRLEGKAIATRVGGILSEPIPFGAVQVPPDGQPIVLLKDRQTIGGYPKLGVVHPLDAFALAQRQPGGRIQFERSEAAVCAREWTDFLRFMLRR